MSLNIYIPFIPEKWIKDWCLLQYASCNGCCCVSSFSKFLLNFVRKLYYIEKTQVRNSEQHGDCEANNKLNYSCLPFWFPMKSCRPLVASTLLPDNRDDDEEVFNEMVQNNVPWTRTPILSIVILQKKYILSIVHMQNGYPAAMLPSKMERK